MLTYAGIMIINFQVNFSSFGGFRENYFPRKLLENCKFAKFISSENLKNSKFSNINFNFIVSG